MKLVSTGQEYLGEGRKLQNLNVQMPQSQAVVTAPYLLRDRLLQLVRADFVIYRSIDQPSGHSGSPSLGVKFILG